MAVALITHPACLGHDPGPFHPERPARLESVLKALDAEEFRSLRREAAPLAGHEDLRRLHPDRYLEAILAIAPEPGEYRALDPDTAMSAGSVEAALRAAGGAIAGVDAVMEGRVRASFVAVRPPGHHAEPARAMGFCLFNNVAIAALHARARWGLKRIAIVDFDVHHGNGTEAACLADPDLFYGSSHQSPCYPGTGLAAKRGIAGNVVNAPLPPGTGSRIFRQAWQSRLLPELDRFAPELLLISAGFDGHEADPLAEFRLHEEDFTWLTGELMHLAEVHASARVVSVLEGGYDLTALATSTAAHVRRLMQPDRQHP
ncbi:MAG: histone deacetylase family protein [Acetobacteraceae bacterium]